MARLDREKSISEEELLQVWEAAVGKSAATHAKPTSLQKGVLRVVVDNPGWTQNLTLSKRKTLKKLQSRFGKDKIVDIRFRIVANI